MKTVTPTLRISPVAGRVVRDPALRDLVTSPRTVPDTAFWRRRIRDGDVAPYPDAPAARDVPGAPADASRHADVPAEARAGTTKRDTPKTSG